MKKFLNGDEREQLITQHRKEKNGRTRDRIKAVLMSDTGWTFKDIAEALLIDEETISRHIKEYIESKKLSISTGGSEGKLSSEQAAEIIKCLEETTYLKVSQICIYIGDKYGVAYTVNGMTNWLKSNGFSYKKPKGTPAKADPIAQKEFIEEYEKMIKSTPDNEPVLFIDGVHPTMATKVTYGWIRTGKNKPIATTGSKIRMNILGVINLNTMRVDVKSYDTINQDSMVDYFAKLREIYPKEQHPKIHIISDRGSYNTSKKTKEEAKIRGIILHFLPPYSPNLNPIERLWKVMNEYTRNNQFFRTGKEFKEKINNFFDITWPTIANTMTSRINDNFQRI
ncbi:MAG: IS630 family transposase [Chitinophagales bacterium]